MDARLNLLWPTPKHIVQLDGAYITLPRETTVVAFASEPHDLAAVGDVVMRLST